MLQHLTSGSMASLSNNLLLLLLLLLEREKGSLSDFGIELKLQMNNLHTAAASYSTHGFIKGAL